MSTPSVVVVLAAGRGSRFGGASHKLAQSLGSATVLATTLRHAIASQLQVVVVTTKPLADVARSHVAAREVIVLPEIGTDQQAALGMGYSIGAGVNATPHAAGWIVLPGDMPLVQPSTVLAIARELGHHPVVYAQYRGRRGHPVGFSCELYSELARLTGDEGARRLVARYPSLGLEVEDAGVLVDIDTPADLESVRLGGGWTDDRSDATAGLSP